MKKKLTGIVTLAAVLVLSFGLGAYANSTWLSYNNNAEKSEGDVDRIMEILRDVNSNKITADEALKEVEKLVTELQGEVVTLKAEIKAAKDKGKESEEHIKHLTKELEKANKAVDEMNKKTKKALTEAEDMVK